MVTSGVLLGHFGGTLWSLLGYSENHFGATHGSFWEYSGCHFGDTLESLLGFSWVISGIIWGHGFGIDWGSYLEYSWVTLRVVLLGSR